jgi:Serine/threonine protein kinase
MRFPGGILDGPERELWRRADALFDRLLDEPEHTRQSRLLELTDDPALRERVRRLLAAHARSSGPLDQPPPGLPPPAAALAGQRLGRWRLEEEIGRGGMAVVYRARAEDGAEGQLAAVKVLTLGSLARDGRERFLREQQALLRLRHPYIAALYDAGVSADGTPWLAMQLVEGEPIDRWCARHRLDVPARVRLLLQVCEALDYSHRNLVVHRDIKPSTCWWMPTAMCACSISASPAPWTGMRRPPAPRCMRSRPSTPPRSSSPACRRPRPWTCTARRPCCTAC